MKGEPRREKKKAPLISQRKILCTAEPAPLKVDQKDMKGILNVGMGINISTRPHACYLQYSHSRTLLTGGVT